MRRYDVSAVWRRVALFGLLAVFLGVGTGCSRVKDKLQRLAQAAEGKMPEVVQVDSELTEDEQKLNALLESPDLFEPAPDADLPKAVPFELNKGSVVSILGYHDFKEKGGEPMVMNQTKFREQMQFIKDSGISVISLQDMMDWKAGVKNIPDESFVITIDDGWLGVHTYAFPVLKEFEFPFTIYLYKKYVNVGGRSLKWEQIREMLDSGLCEVGSHSVSHDSMTARKGRSDEAYRAYLEVELKDSKEFLEQNLGVEVTSFAYPYGNYNAQIRDFGMELGYQSLVTVNGSKVRWDTHAGDLGRFIILGNDDSVFKLATTFRGRSLVEAASSIKQEEVGDDGKPLYELSPAAESTVTTRTPLLVADLSGLSPIQAGSLRLVIAGQGQVEPKFDPETHTVSYQVPARLRRERFEASLQFKREGSDKTETIGWAFKVDLAANYVPLANTQ
jgi:peptidoglycan/xylan/chitin deacetylase (PgdA/CDA1 family)